MCGHFGTPALPRSPRLLFTMDKVLAAFVSAPAVSRGLVAVCVMSMSAACWAQETIRPPTPGKPENPGLVMQIFLAALGVGLVAGFFLLKAKRGHQD